STVGLARLLWDWTTPTSPTLLDVIFDDHRVLTYATEPVTTPLTIEGSPELTVFLISDQPDFALTVWLSDVAPNGFATLICQGWARPMHLASEPLESDKTYAVGATLGPTCYRLPAGHRLRLAIGGA